MGILLIGHYGEEPESQSSLPVTLRDCNEQLGLKPAHFISAEPPDFFQKARKAMGRYLVFQLKAEESNAIWKAGYYLLPLDPKEAARVLNRTQANTPVANRKPVEVDCDEEVPADVLERAKKWAYESQSGLFECRCEKLILKLSSPWGFRRRWSARLNCDNKCQPAQKTIV